MGTERLPGDGQRITDELRDLILTGGVLPGERIGQEELAARFRTSRMPVREALRQLESEELVVIKPRSGAWVAKLDNAEFVRLYELREVFEPLVVRKSLEHMTPEQISHVHELGDAVDEITGDATRFDEFIDRERAFHLATFAGAPFPGYRDRAEQLWNQTQHHRRIVARHFTTAEVACTRADHALMRYYLDVGDAEALGEVVRLHIRRTRLVAARHPDAIAD